MSFMIDILHEGHKKLEERVLTVESALTKTKKELLETEKEVAILSLFGEVGRSTKHVSHKSPRLKPRDQTIAFFFSGLYNSTVFSTIDIYQFESRDAS